MADEKTKTKSNNSSRPLKSVELSATSRNLAARQSPNTENTSVAKIKKVKKETKLTGIGVSKGVIAGKIVRLHGSLQIFRVAVVESEIAKEVRRFRVAIRLTRQRLKKIKQLATESFGTEQAYIFDAHLLMLEDRSLLEQVEAHIQTAKVNAEWAIKVVSDNILAVYSDIEDDYLRERRADIEDVIQRLLFSLSGGKQATRHLEKEAVLLAEEILPSTIAELSRENIRAIVTEKGGWTSHSFILARELGLPAVSGIKNVFQKAQTGDSVIVDGFNGRIVLHPKNETYSLYRTPIAQTLEARSVTFESGLIALKTVDEIEITIRANVDLAGKYEECKKFGAQGIGLYRSEFLFGKNGRVPTEREQMQAYQQLAEIAEKHRARIRLFDIGNEHLIEQNRQNERNPALGLRAIRLGFGA